MTRKHEPPVVAAMTKDKPDVWFSLSGPVGTTMWMTDYTDVFLNSWGEFYQPLINRKGLARLTRANAYHGVS